MAGRNLFCFGIFIEWHMSMKTELAIGLTDGRLVPGIVTHHCWAVIGRKEPGWKDDSQIRGSMELWGGARLIC